MRKAFCFMVFFATLFPSGATAQTDDGVTFHRKNVQDKDADGWYPAMSTEGHFSVKMPRPFNDTSAHIPDSNTGMLSMYMIANPLTGDGWELSASEMEVERISKKGSIEDLAKKLAGSFGKIGPLERSATEESIEGENGTALTAGVRFKIIYSLPNNRFLHYLWLSPLFHKGSGRDLPQIYSIVRDEIEVPFLLRISNLTNPPP